jgi:uncharacterized membrane protein YagU involved in acid resistance
MGRLLAGAVSGFGATLPMTAAMVAMHRGLPKHQRFPLPPRRVTMNFAKHLGIKHKLDERQRKGLTLLAHFGYGTAVGGLFGLFAPRKPALSIPIGICYGILVWTFSYLGLLPALDLHEPATRHPKQRNILMILAHVVWGATLGAVAPLIRGSK